MNSPAIRFQETRGGSGRQHPDRGILLPWRPPDSPDGDRGLTVQQNFPDRAIRSSSSYNIFASIFSINYIAVFFTDDLFYLVFVPQ